MEASLLRMAEDLWRKDIRLLFIFQLSKHKSQKEFFNITFFIKKGWKRNQIERYSLQQLWSSDVSEKNSIVDFSMISTVLIPTTITLPTAEA
jgi:hypothetical protein